MATTKADTPFPQHIGELKHDPKNPRKHNPRNIGQIERSLQKFGPMRPIVIDEDDVVIAGNGVLEAAASAGIEHVRVYDRTTGEMGPANPEGGPSIIAIRVTGLTDAEKRQYAVADNRTTDLSEWDGEMMAALMEEGYDFGDWFFDDELTAIIDAFEDDAGEYDAGDGEGDGGTSADEARQTLADRFLVPPFSVLDGRQGYWQDRKDAWLALGIRSELGRGENLLHLSEEAEDYRQGRGDYSKSGAVMPAGNGGMADGLLEKRSAEKEGRPPSGRLTFATGNERTDPVSKMITDTQRKGSAGGGSASAYSPGFKGMSHAARDAGDLNRGSNGNGPARTFDNGVSLGSGMAEQMVQKMGGPTPGSKNDRRPGREPGEYEGGHAWITSTKSGGAKGMKGRPPHGPKVTQNPDGTLNYEATNNGEAASGTSVFDPVICELAYRWFTPEGGSILDPFAGGSVRGIVAATLGRRYTGIDLSEPQIEANKKQAADILQRGHPKPDWRVGDSRQVVDILGSDTKYDFLFSCPPYADLEVYSDDPRDLSTLAYAEFRQAYREIISASASLLKDDRFACFVVGDVRDRKGNYYNFVSDTIGAFIDAGMHLYNEAILVTPVGSLAIRVGRQFVAGRKLGKSHQNVLVFVKGDAKKATQACGDISVDDLTALADGFIDDEYAEPSAEDDAEADAE